MPSSNCLCGPGRRDWFGGKSSTRIATFSMRERNSSGSESKTPSATLKNSSRFMAHHSASRLANDLARRQHLLHLLYAASACVFHLGSRIPDNEFLFVSE